MTMIWMKMNLWDQQRPTKTTLPVNVSVFTKYTNRKSLWVLWNRFCRRWKKSEVLSNEGCQPSWALESLTKFENIDLMNSCGSMMSCEIDINIVAYPIWGVIISIHWVILLTGRLFLNFPVTKSPPPPPISILSRLSYIKPLPAQSKQTQGYQQNTHHILWMKFYVHFPFQTLVSI